MRRTNILLLVVMLATSNLSVGARARTLRPAAQAESGAASLAKVERLLGESGYTYKKVSGDVWLISRQGKSFPEFRIIVTVGPGFWLAGVIVAEKKQMRVNADLMFKLLRLNHSQDFVKIGFDDDEDLFVRRESGTRLLDLQDFKSHVESVATAADKVYGEVKLFLNAP